MTCHVTGAGVEYDPKQQATANESMQSKISARLLWIIFLVHPLTRLMRCSYGVAGHVLLGIES